MIRLMAKSVFRLLDIIIIGFSVAVVILLSVHIYSSGSGEAVLKITAADSEYVYPLDQDTELEYRGPDWQYPRDNQRRQRHISPNLHVKINCASLWGRFHGTGTVGGLHAEQGIHFNRRGKTMTQEIDVLSY